MDIIIDILLDTILDTIKLIPFLIVAFLIIEYIEHKLSKKSKRIISKSGKFGPIIGSLLGLIPQCGFSVLATNLYITRIISLGTLIAIYLSTSDEMLPILISENAPIKTIILILGIKLVVGLISGIIIDLIFKNKTKEKETYDICEHEHCGCNHDHNIIKSSIIHTIKTISFIFIISIVINAIFAYGEEQLLSKLLLKDSILAPFITSLIGLIPNCGASVIITELYLNNALSLGGIIGGLLTNSGVAILVLFKSNDNIKDSIKVLGITYSIGVITGIIIEIITLII